MTKVSSVIVPYASYLRVYEPLAAFPEPERGHWERYARRDDLPSYQEELRRSLADLAAVPPAPVPVHESGDAFVLETDGEVRVCPWRTRLRGWQTLGELAEEYPLPVLDALLPPVVRHEASRDYERWLAEHPDARPWIRTSTWQVPINWFVLFTDEERQYAKGSAGEVPVLRYRTPMVQARRRVARALRALRDAVDESADRRPGGRRPLAGGVPPAVAGRAGLRGAGARRAGRRPGGRPLGGRRRRGDRGAAAGRRRGAAEAYGRLVERWRAVRDLRSAN